MAYLKACLISATNNKTKEEATTRLKNALMAFQAFVVYTQEGFFKEEADRATKIGCEIRAYEKFIKDKFKNEGPDSTRRADDN